MQHLILRVLLGQEKNSKGKIRTWGTIEALLLLTDWHPRALAFPPPIDGWDSDLLVHWTADCNDTPLQEANEARERWLEDIINPAKRTSHMSWMLTNCAVSLGVELGAFSEQNSSRYPPLDDVDSYRQDHIRKLLGLYAEQVALQHGRQSLLPQAAAHQIFRDSLNVRHERKDLSWFVDAWLNLTKLTRMVMETLYASGHQTSQLLHTGRYASLVEHFQPMLSSWRDRYLDKDRLPGKSCVMIG